MSKGSIRLHPKHGLNPTMPVCFWCGQDTGEVALLGAAYKDEAPRRMVIGQNPCEKCKAQMAQGITFMEVTENREYTGRWCVITEDAVRRMVNTDTPGGQQLLDDTLRLRKAHIDTALFDQLTKPVADAASG